MPDGPIDDPELLAELEEMRRRHPDPDEQRLLGIDGSYPLDQLTAAGHARSVAAVNELEVIIEAVTADGTVWIDAREFGQADLEEICRFAFDGHGNVSPRALRRLSVLTRHVTRRRPSAGRRRRTTPRARARRARHIARSTSSSDPGGDEPPGDTPPPRLTLARPPAARYTFACIPAEARS